MLSDVKMVFFKEPPPDFVTTYDLAAECRVRWGGSMLSHARA